MNGSGPAKVADHIIDELKSRERDGLVILPAALRPAPWTRFKAGDRVKITDGPMRGFLGLVEGLRANERVAILLQMLGSERSIEMSAADVEPARE